MSAASRKKRLEQESPAFAELRDRIALQFASIILGAFVNEGRDTISTALASSYPLADAVLSGRAAVRPEKS